MKYFRNDGISKASGVSEKSSKEQSSSNDNAVEEKSPEESVDEVQKNLETMQLDSWK